MPRLSRITIYPIKSLDGRDVPQSVVLPSGALQHDRRWAILDGQGLPMNGKRTPAVHAVRASFHDDLTTAELRYQDRTATFRLDSQSTEAAAWLSEVFQQGCRLVENPHCGFPDDEDAKGPTLISEASLAEVASWFGGWTPAESRRRFRANLEIADWDSFWEDQLSGASGHGRRFKIGQADFYGRRVCQRCIVPARDADTGEAVAGFAKRFAQRREESLPKESPRDRFDHFYRIAINTSVASTPIDCTIRVGDSVQLVS
jgi:uncharacterized protein YcbX